MAPVVYFLNFRHIWNISVSSLLQNLESKQEAQEKNRLLQQELQKLKLAEKLERVERAQKELEIQTEAARVAAECALNAKLSKVYSSVNYCTFFYIKFFYQNQHTVDF